MEISCLLVEIVFYLFIYFIFFQKCSSHLLYFGVPEVFHLSLLTARVMMIATILMTTAVVMMGTHSVAMVVTETIRIDILDQNDLPPHNMSRVRNNRRSGRKNCDRKVQQLTLIISNTDNSNYSLTHCRLNRLSQIISWKSPISILGR